MPISAKILSLLCLFMLAHSCHYSCSTCANSNQLYTSCVQCNEGTLTVIQDTSTMPSQYWSSVYDSGACTGEIDTAANALGILMFIVVVGAALIIQTKEVFYLLIVFQTIGLFSLVEVAWVSPLGYVLKAFQYFMIFTVMSKGYKNANDWTLVTSKNYRLRDFIVETDLGNNIAIIAAFTLVSLILIIVIIIISCYRSNSKVQEQAIKSDKQNQNIFEQSNGKSNSQRMIEESQKKQAEQSCTKWKWFSQNVLKLVSKFLLCLLFYMIQQTSVVLLVTLVFKGATSGPIIISIIYLHILVFVMGYCYYYRVEYFKKKSIMYINFARKIVMPVMVVIPIDKQYLFCLFIGAFLAFQLFFNYYNGLFQKLNRLAVYKLIEACTVVILIIYYFVEESSTKAGSSKAAAIAAVFIISIFCFVFFIEVCFGVKLKFFKKKNENKVVFKQQDTQENINSNKLKGQNTLDIIDINSKNSDDERELEKLRILKIQEAERLQKERLEKLKLQEQQRERLRKLKEQQKERLRLKKMKEEEQEKQRLRLLRLKEEEKENQRLRLLRLKQEEEEKERLRVLRLKEEEEKEKLRLQRIKQIQQYENQKKQRQRLQKEQRERKRQEQKQRKFEQQLQKERLRKLKLKAEAQERERLRLQKLKEEQQREKQRLRRIKDQEQEQQERKKKRRKQVVDKELRSRYGI